MWDSINKILANIDDFVWGVPLMAIIITGGILLTFRLGFLQLRRLASAAACAPAAAACIKMDG